MRVALAALLALAAPANARQFDNLVTATVGWSEWCPPGTVHLDLETGHYEWIKQLRRPTCGRNAAAPIVRAVLAPGSLEQVRAAVRTARQEGLVRAECKAGTPPPSLVSNAGGPYVLLISGPRDSLGAPTNLSCWTGAATRLRRLMEQSFEVPRPPSR